MTNARARVAAALTAVGAAVLFWRKRAGGAATDADAAEPVEAEPEQ